MLVERGIMDRKGFPESYDTRALLGFLRAVKSGADEVSAPVYDHVAYDILSGEFVVVRRPDIVIVEGLNVLQVNRDGDEFVSDYFDFSIYVDADEADIEEWYVSRFFALFGRRSSRTRTAISVTSPSSPTTRPMRPLATSGRRSTVATSSRTSLPPASGRA